MTAQIIFVAIGGYFLIVNGILGKTWSRASRYSEKMGTNITRIIYIVAGIALIVYGILGIINPDIAPQ